MILKILSMKRTRLRREIANEIHPLYSSGHFFERASINEAAEVTTP